MLRLLRTRVAVCGIVGALVQPATWAAAEDADDLLVVDCALPGQIRQLGRATTYLAPRRAERTTALDCRVRGGEYVVHDRASLRTSLEVWMPQARAGDPEAQTVVGELFERGLGSTPDHAAAAAWYQRAAEGGSTRARVNLGNLYEKGLGVPRDAAEALRWYRRASGLPEAVALETVPDVAPLLAARERAIDGLHRQVGGLEQETVRLRRELAQAQRTLEASQGAETEADANAARALVLERQLEQTVTVLRAREAELNRQSAEIAGLLAAQQVQAVPAAALDAGLLAGPEIVLIEPAVDSTRGLVKVSVAPAADVQRVVGRVSAPAGILTASVNDRPVEINGAGVFLAEVPVAGRQTDVVVTVIDRQGKRADLELVLGRLEDQEGAAPRRNKVLPTLRSGIDYALLIGNDNYRHLPRLHTPIADVERIEAVLAGRYGFRTRTLYDATRYDTLSALNGLRERLTSEDRLLIYYAGHGELDETNMRGHWLPVDAEADNTANWLSNVDITDILNVIRARQVLLVVDSCYSGTLTRSSLSRLEVGLTAQERATWLALMASKRARVVLTSGGLAPVLDFGGGAHSVFARSFIEALESNTDLLLGRSLYQAVAARVAHAAAGYDFEQIPQYAPIAGAGHESGDFILQPRTRAR